MIYPCYSLPHCFPHHWHRNIEIGSISDIDLVKEVASSGKVCSVSKSASHSHICPHAISSQSKLTTEKLMYVDL